MLTCIWVKLIIGTIAATLLSGIGPLIGLTSVMKDNKLKPATLIQPLSQRFFCMRNAPIPKGNLYLFVKTTMRTDVREFTKRKTHAKAKGARLASAFRAKYRRPVTFIDSF